MSESRRLIAWAERGQETFLNDAIRQAELELIAIGSPSAATADGLAESFGVEKADDLRQAVQRDDVNLLWLAAPERIEADERRLIAELGLPTISSVPRPVAIADLLSMPEAGESAVFVPLFRRSPGYRAAMDVLEEFARPQSISVSMGCGAGEGALFARLFDAMDVVTALAGDAEGIDAAMAGPLSGIPESLEDLHGHMTVNMRFSENCCACIATSDLAGSWFRRVTILGTRGRLSINDCGYEWIGEDGEPIETGGAGSSISPGELIGMQITRMLENLDSPAVERPPDTGSLLALCEAARLSCRTGQSETPEKLRKMLSKP